jgi:hypothetical protein
MCPILPGSPAFTPSAPECEMPSQDVIVVGDAASKRYILAGAITAHRSMTYFTLVKRGRFHSILVKQPDITPDAVPEEVIVLEGDDWRKLLIQYADQAARAMAVKPIKAEKNMTPLEYIHQLKIQKAEMLLKSGSYTNEEISELCGFRDVKYFYVLLKKMTGNTTKVYKN